MFIEPMAMDGGPIMANEKADTAACDVELDILDA